MEEREKIAKSFLPFFQRRLKSLLGRRKINEKELKDLESYWAGAITPSCNPREGMSKKDFYALSLEEQLKLSLKEGGGWGRGIEKYSRFAGEPIRRIIGSAIKKRGRAQVLDIGCGIHTFEKELKAEYGDKVGCYGVSNERPPHTPIDITFKLALAEVLPYEWEDMFDLVTCFESSQYFYDHLRTFREVSRVTCEGGTFFYSHGGLKYLSAGGDDLIEKLMNAKNERYSYNEITCKGMEARWTRKYHEFCDVIGNLINSKQPVSFEGRKWHIEERVAAAWCQNTIRARGVKKEDSR